MNRRELLQAGLTFLAVAVVPIAVAEAAEALTLDTPQPITQHDVLASELNRMATSFCDNTDVCTRRVTHCNIVCDNTDVCTRRVTHCNIVCDEDLILLEGDVFENCKITSAGGGLLIRSSGERPCSFNGCSIDMSAHPTANRTDSWWRYDNTRAELMPKRARFRIG